MCSNLVHGYHLCALQMSLDMHNVGWNVRADWSQYIIDVWSVVQAGPKLCITIPRSCCPAHALVALYSCVAIMFMKTILVRYKMHYNVGWNIQDNWLEFVINVNCCASRCQIVHGSWASWGIWIFNCCGYFSTTSSCLSNYASEIRSWKSNPPLLGRWDKLFIFATKGGSRVVSCQASWSLLRYALYNWWLNTW